MVKAVAGTVIARAEVARVAEEAAAVNVAEGGGSDEGGGGGGGVRAEVARAAVGGAAMTC